MIKNETNGKTWPWWIEDLLNYAKAVGWPMTPTANKYLVNVFIKNPITSDAYFWDLVVAYDRHYDVDALETLLHRYFPPERVLGRKWPSIKPHLGQGGVDLETGKPLGPKSAYFQIASSVIALAFSQPEDLSLIDPDESRGFHGSLESDPPDQIPKLLEQVIRREIRKDAYGPWGEGQYTQHARIVMDSANEEIYGLDVHKLSGSMEFRYKPQSQEISPEDYAITRLDRDNLPNIPSLDTHTPAERNALQIIYQALAEGCEFDSKRGRSLRQYLGPEYESVMRNYRRAAEKCRDVQEIPRPQTE